MWNSLKPNLHLGVYRNHRESEEILQERRLRCGERDAISTPSYYARLTTGLTLPSPGVLLEHDAIILHHFDGRMACSGEALFAPQSCDCKRKATTSRARHPSASGGSALIAGVVAMS